MRLAIPENLRLGVGGGRDAGRRAWFERLPETVARYADRWGVEVGPPFEPGGQTAWVAPASRAGEPLVLKIGWRHDEARDEAAGLGLWADAGAGAVLVHDAEAVRDVTALLIERCEPGTTLAERPEPEQDEVIAGLFERLWAVGVPGEPFRPLAEMCAWWADESEARPLPGVDAGLRRAGLELFRTLPGSVPAARQVLLATDLHAENVLAARREPWLVIDPKPYVGDPAYDPLQHLFNCVDRLRADPIGLIHRMADLCGLDRERLRLWTFARAVQEAPSWARVVDLIPRLAPD